MIQGAPGTGKTTLCCDIIRMLVENGFEKFLVCAPSDVATDKLCLRLNENGIKALRIYSKG